MATIPLPSLLPNIEILLHLPVEDVAGALLVHLNSYVHNNGAIAQHGKLSQSEFFSWLWKNPPYPGNQQEFVQRVFLEAWSWLQSEGLLARALDSHHLFFITRRGAAIKRREDFDSYRKGSLLPKHQLHPLIANAVYPIFLSGKYDTAIFEAFRQVEMAVREAGFLKEEPYYGSDLMRVAFRPVGEKKGQVITPGPLADPRLPVAEQEAMAHMFAGAIGVFRNSTGHRNVGNTAEGAAEVIISASMLLRIVETQRFRIMHEMTTAPRHDFETLDGQ